MLKTLQLNDGKSCIICYAEEESSMYMTIKCVVGK